MKRAQKKPLLMLSGMLLLLIFSPVAQSTELQLTLPPQIYAVAGQEMNVYFANTILAEDSSDYRFQVDCDAGSAEVARWHVKPTEKEIGQHNFSLTVQNSAGEELDSANSTLIVVPADAGKKLQVRLLIIGDSLTHATMYPNRIASLLSSSGNPKFKMLGTHKPARAEENVAHEGYGGWTWHRFAAHYEPNPDGTHRKRSSPFVFTDSLGKPQLDVERYIDEHCQGIPPTVVIFKLGINDCFHADPDSSQAIEQKISDVFSHANHLISTFRQAAPEAMLGICLTTPGNARDAAFDANYKGRYTRWGWRRIQHRLVQRQIEHFSGHESNNVFLIPTELNLDVVDGYPDNNAVHPNLAGYNQIGDSIYAWLKYRLNQQP